MNKILYVLDNNQSSEYQYNIVEDTIIFHFSINSSSKVKINLLTEGVQLYYYYSNINYSNHEFSIDIRHMKSNTHSEVINHGVNVFNKKLKYSVNGIVEKDCSGCICNQENEIINMDDGKSEICPNLIIDNYDVVANHGAYIGKFPFDKIFYLMSRGITRDEANRLLLHGFLIESDSIDVNRISQFLDEIQKI